jgi:hypothetical protein
MADGWVWAEGFSDGEHVELQCGCEVVLVPGRNVVTAAKGKSCPHREHVTLAAFPLASHALVKSVPVPIPFNENKLRWEIDE